MHDDRTAIYHLQRKSGERNRHMTVGDLIDELDLIIDHEHDGGSLPVLIDMGRGQIVSPLSPMSFRGFYDQLAFDYFVPETDSRATTAKGFRDLLVGCLGETFPGPKGGEFYMDEATPVWFSPHMQAEMVYPSAVVIGTAGVNVRYVAIRTAEHLF